MLKVVLRPGESTDSLIRRFNKAVQYDGIIDEAKGQTGSVNSISALGIITTVIKLGTFDFGNTLGLPFWLDAIYTVLGVLFIVVIARNIWVGGGG